MKPYPGTPLQFGSEGPDVLLVQAALGFGAGGQTGKFGPTTEATVVTFQRGHALEPDGVVGPNTWEALFLPLPLPTLGGEAVRVAYVEVGTEERPRGSNRGPKVDWYLRAAGVEPPAYWCAAFVFWCVQEAARRRGLPQPLPSGGPRYNCAALYHWAKAHGRLVPHPLPGDIFLCIGGPNGHYHTGFVIGAIEGDRYPTIEGNSNNDGSANGYAVVERRPGRRLADAHYVRL